MVRVRRVVQDVLLLDVFYDGMRLSKVLRVVIVGTCLLMDRFVAGLALACALRILLLPRRERVGISANGLARRVEFLFAFDKERFFSEHRVLHVLHVLRATLVVRNAIFEDRNASLQVYPPAFKCDDAGALVGVLRDESLHVRRSVRQRCAGCIELLFEVGNRCHADRAGLTRVSKMRARNAVGTASAKSEKEPVDILVHAACEGKRAEHTDKHRHHGEATERISSVSTRVRAAGGQHQEHSTGHDGSSET
jgi:hypothetical protein